MMNLTTEQRREVRELVALNKRRGGETRGFIVQQHPTLTWLMSATMGYDQGVRITDWHSDYDAMLRELYSV